MRPLLLDDKNRSEIKRVIEYAHKNPFTMDDLLDIKNKQMTVAGDMLGYTCDIDFGYRVVFSIEKQVQGDTFHLSISVNEEGKLPSVPSVEAIMEEIGFQNKLEDCIVKLEEISPKRQAINVWEVRK